MSFPKGPPPLIPQLFYLSRAGSLGGQTPLLSWCLFSAGGADSPEEEGEENNKSRKKKARELEEGKQKEVGDSSQGGGKSQIHREGKGGIHCPPAGPHSQQGNTRQQNAAKHVLCVQDLGLITRAGQMSGKMSENSWSTRSSVAAIRLHSYVTHSCSSSCGNCTSTQT